MANQSRTKTIYTARSQFWFENSFFKPIDMGGRALEEGDPFLKSHPHMFEEYTPRTRQFGQPELRKDTVIARIVPDPVPDPEPEPEPVPAHTHPH